MDANLTVGIGVWYLEVLLPTLWAQPSHLHTCLPNSLPTFQHLPPVLNMQCKMQPAH